MNTVQSEAGNKDALIERLIGGLISRARCRSRALLGITTSGFTARLLGSPRTAEARIFVVGRERALTNDRSRFVQADCNSPFIGSRGRVSSITRELTAGRNS